MLKNRFFTVFCLCSGVTISPYAWSQNDVASAAVVGGTQAANTTFTTIRSTDAGVSPETIFDARQKLATSVTINVDPAHLGKAAAIFIVARYQNLWFMKNEAGQWIAWDGNPANLSMNKIVPGLAASESVIVEPQLSNLPGSFEVYVGYKLDNTYTFNATPFAFQVVTGKLNDTGVYYCANATQYLDPNKKDSLNNLIPFTCPMPSFLGQDGEYGRDATNNDNSDGQAGFSFTKVSNTGAILKSSEPTWDCVRDNVTGLLWENKKPSIADLGSITAIINATNPPPSSVDDIRAKINALTSTSLVVNELKLIVNAMNANSVNELTAAINQRITAYQLHSQDNIYSWYNPDTTTNGGTQGIINGGSCAGGSTCDTDGFVKQVNVTGLCGFNTGWRLPTKNELLSIVDNTRYAGKITTVTDAISGAVSSISALAAIDPNYFPNTPALDFWTSSPMANGKNDAWSVYFYYGTISYNSNKNNQFRVRLVRG